MINKAKVFLMKDLLWKAEKRGDKKCAIAFLQLVTKELEKVSFILTELEWKEKNGVVWLWEEDRRGKKKKKRIYWRYEKERFWKREEGVGFYYVDYIGFRWVPLLVDNKMRGELFWNNFRTIWKWIPYLRNLLGIIGKGGENLLELTEWIRSKKEEN